MKKVLIIANLFHASPRIPSIAKYLPEFCWTPIILTNPLNQESYRQAGFYGLPQDFLKSGIKIIEVPSPNILYYWKNIYIG